MANELSLKDSATALAKSEPLLGMDGVDRSDMNVRPPEIKIVQGMRPDSIRGRRDLAEGDLYDSLTQEKLPDELVIIPVFAWNQYLEWEGTGEDAKVTRGTTDPNAEWVKGNTRPTKKADGTWQHPKVTKYLRMLVMRPGLQMPCLLSFSKTSLSCGEQVIMSSMVKGKSLFETALILTSKGVASKQGGQYYIYSARPHAEAVPDEFKTQAKAWITQYASLKQEVQTEEA